MAQESETSSRAQPARSALPVDAFAKLSNFRSPLPLVIAAAGVLFAITLWITLSGFRNDGSASRTTAAERVVVDRVAAAGGQLDVELGRVEDAMVDLRAMLTADGAPDADRVAKTLGEFVPGDEAPLITELIYVGPTARSRQIRVVAPAGSDDRWEPEQVPAGSREQAIARDRVVVVETTEAAGRTVGAHDWVWPSDAAHSELRVVLAVAIEPGSSTPSDPGTGWLSAMVASTIPTDLLDPALASYALSDVSLRPSSEVVENATDVGTGAGAARVRRTTDGENLRIDLPIIALGTGWEVSLETPRPAAGSGGFVPELATLGMLLLTAAAAVTAHHYLRDGAQAMALARSTSEDLMASNARFRTSFENSPIGVAEVDVGGRVTLTNAALRRQLRLTGRPPDQTDYVALVHPGDRDAAQSRVISLVSGDMASTQVDHRYLDSAGREVWVSEAMSAMVDANGLVQSILVQAEDITERRTAQQRLRHQAMHDVLTGLPNRALFLDRLSQALSRSRQDRRPLAVMFVDIDRFKTVNDSLGHAEGDQLLREVAQRIASAVREPDTVARFGGDEFVVLCERMRDEDEATDISERIKAAVCEPVELSGELLSVTASVGMMITSDPDMTAHDALRDADAAMYQAKRAGRAETHLADTDTRDGAQTRFEIERDLRRAINNGELRVHYQPLLDAITREWVGVEALVRWQHPTKGLLSPSSFLPTASDMGVLPDIDQWMATRCLEQLGRWAVRYPLTRHWHMALNATVESLSSSRYLVQISDALDQAELDPSRLMIEVTEETLLTDAEASARTLRGLQERGVLIAVDDFGTGYSSLSYLPRFSIDVLKIDQEFVRALPEPAAASVVQAIIDLAHTLDMQVVAEGVERPAQADVLASMGAEILQGYHLGKPLPTRQLEDELVAMQARLTAHHLPVSAEVIGGEAIGRLDRSRRSELNEIRE